MKAKILSALLYMRNVFTLLIILFLSSCLYSTKYIANYTVQNKSTEKSIKDVSIGFINQLAQKNQLRKDSTLKGTDTLGFYGSPYHYFKFWFEQQNNQITIKLNYDGSFGSRKNPPYRSFLQNLNDSILANFTLINIDIKETNNAKRN
jgi:ABC-type transport system involved in multi-copper enzyme maturation permease subunit